jgi:cytochrome c oxidase assembly factor CtaG
MNWIVLSWRVLVIITVVFSVLVYRGGWRRLRTAVPALAQPLRLASFVAGALCVVIALASPLATLSQSYLLARTGQQVLLCMLAPPLLWLACPFHNMAWGSPIWLRRGLAHWFVRPSRLTPLLNAVTQLGVVWLLFLCSFFLWHDPLLVNAAAAYPLVRTLSLIWLFLVALLFWWQITTTGPQRYTHDSPLARVAMLISVEIPNLATGITLAFASSPIYLAYSNTFLTGAVDATRPPVADQFASGVLLWIVGSLVYISSAILVINQVFRREGIGQAQPAANWDAEEKFIAPGLEDRLFEVGRERHDWEKH